MTEDEARAVLKIMVSADGYCGVCASNLCERFVKAYPEFKGLADETLSRMKEYRDAELAALDGDDALDS